MSRDVVFKHLNISTSCEKGVGVGKAHPAIEPSTITKVPDDMCSNIF
jgi:hypothetical protein